MQKETDHSHHCKLMLEWQSAGGAFNQQWPNVKKDSYSEVKTSWATPSVKVGPFILLQQDSARYIESALGSARLVSHLRCTSEMFRCWALVNTQ